MNASKTFHVFWQRTRSESPSSPMGACASTRQRPPARGIVNTGTSNARPRFARTAWRRDTHISKPSPPVLNASTTTAAPLGSRFKSPTNPAFSPLRTARSIFSIDLSCGITRCTSLLLKRTNSSVSPGFLKSSATILAPPTSSENATAAHSQFPSCAHTKTTPRLSALARSRTSEKPDISMYLWAFSPEIRGDQKRESIVTAKFW